MRARRALVVFHGEGGGFWAWLCGRPGFRHCFAALNDGRAWILVDGRGDGLEVSAEIPASFDLAAHYRGLGYAVVAADVVAERRRYRLPAAFTCVETVKRLLGLKGWALLTPYQLFKRLEADLGQHLLAAETESATATATTAQARRP